MIAIVLGENLRRHVRHVMMMVMEMTVCQRNHEINISLDFENVNPD
jgi:hypothetical protein